MAAVLFGWWILDPHHGVPLALTTGAAAQVQFMPTGIRHGDWRVARPLTIAVALAIVFGTGFFGALSDARFYRIFQVILLLMAMGLVWKGSVAVL